MKRFLLIAIIFLHLASCTSPALLLPDRLPRPAEQGGEETFTLFWYVNGSDLESGSEHDLGGAFTLNLNEMLSAPPIDGRFSTVIFTGGTKDWKTDGFSEVHNQVHYLTHNGLEHGPILLPEGSIAEPETLASFLRHGIEKAPADRYGLIFWDHGSGVPIGFGYDELREPRYMDMTALAKGLEDGLGGERLAFIGFDACLMATVEVAAAVSPFAEVLIASEELEPFGGWDYAPLMKSLRKNPAISGKDIGKVILNGYFASRKNAGETLTLSVIDLNKIGAVVDAVGALAQGKWRLLEEEGFHQVSRIRSRVKYYGGVNQSVDMIDLVHLAGRLKGSYPAESAQVIAAVRDAVLLNRHTAASPNSNGLSIYFPYENEGVFRYHLDLYLQSGFCDTYLGFVEDFTRHLTMGDSPIYMVNTRAVRRGGTFYTAEIPAEWQILEARGVFARERGYGVWVLAGMDREAEYDTKKGLVSGSPPENGWLHLNGHPAFAYCEDGADGYAVYSVLAELDGRRVSLAVSYKDGGFTFLGAVPEAKDGRIPLPQYQPLEEGDSVTLLYPLIDTRRPGHEEEYERASPFTVKGALRFSFAPAEGEYGFVLTDVYNNEYVTNLPS
jgi:hypothetical protein